MRAVRYTTDESKDKTLQVQDRREVERIKRDNVAPAPLNPASLPTVAATAASHTAGTRRRSETVANAAATTGTTVGPALDINELVTSPIKKIRKTSAQAQSRIGLTLVQQLLSPKRGLRRRVFGVQPNKSSRLW
jgi:hypothetical protein